MGKASYESSFGVNNAMPPRTLAAASLAFIVSEATFLQRTCDGQSANIRKMADEARDLLNERDRLQGVVNQLREMNANQCNTIMELRRQSPKRDFSVHYDCWVRIVDQLRRPDTNRDNPEWPEMCSASDALRDVRKLQREAAYGRKMAAAAGTNIA